MPTCEEYNMNMCVHPDDPPIEILGLPRIVRTEDIAFNDATLSRRFHILIEMQDGITDIGRS